MSLKIEGLLENALPGNIESRTPLTKVMPDQLQAGENVQAGPDEIDKDGAPYPGDPGGHGLTTRI